MRIFCSVAGLFMIGWGLYSILGAPQSRDTDKTTDTRTATWDGSGTQLCPQSALTGADSDKFCLGKIKDTLERSHKWHGNAWGSPGGVGISGLDRKAYVELFNLLPPAERKKNEWMNEWKDIDCVMYGITDRLPVKSTHNDLWYLWSWHLRTVVCFSLRYCFIMQ